MPDRIPACGRQASRLQATATSERLAESMPEFNIFRYRLTIFIYLGSMKKDVSSGAA